MQSENMVLKSRGRFLRLALARPLPMAAACGLLSLGIASGISTGAILNLSGLINAADKPLWLFTLIRTAGFDLSLVLAVLSAVYQRTALPFACAAISLKGAVMGFAVRQLFLEFRFMEALPGAAAVVLSSFPVLTALLIAFVNFGAGTDSDSKNPRTDHEKAYCSVVLALFLALMGILSEGLFVPALLRFVY